MDFCFPSGGSNLFTKTGVSRINSYFENIPPLRPVSVEFLRYWKAKYKSETNHFEPPAGIDEKFDIFLYENSGRDYYSNYFSAICFKEMIVSINIYSNAYPLPLRNHPFFPAEDPGGFSVKATFPNLGILDLGDDKYRILDRHPSIQEILAVERAVICANCFMYVRANCPGETYIPVLVRFYWAKNAQQWLVGDIITANSYTARESVYLIVF